MDKHIEPCGIYKIMHFRLSPLLNIYGPSNEKIRNLAYDHLNGVIQ